MSNKLHTYNYATWKFKLKHLLIAKELYGYIDGSIEAPNGSAEAAVKSAKKVTPFFEFHVDVLKSLQNTPLDVKLGRA